MPGSTTDVALTTKSRVWVFLGDSLTEGIGRKRNGYVSELARLLRNAMPHPVHEMRLRLVDLSGQRDLSFFNMIGFVDRDSKDEGQSLWLLNLAAESTTVADDAGRLSLMSGFNVERIFIMRGPLESILRPQQIHDGHWPAWVPASWRSYGSLDPRCYFSATFWRRIKQRTIDTLKQHVRLKLLSRGGVTILSDEMFISAYQSLFERLSALGIPVTVLAIPPVDGHVFPGTPPVVERRNAALRDLCGQLDIDYFRWKPESLVSNNDLFCRDGFHPSDRGAKIMAGQLFDHLTGAAIISSSA